MKPRVKLDDIALAAGVSKQTVSRALNNKSEIDSHTKERILTLAREMGYRRSRLANAFHTQRTFMVGLVIPDIANPFFGEVARGVQSTAIAADYHVLFCNTEERPEAVLDLMEQLASQGVDAIITFTTDAAESEFLRFADSFKPIVVINREFQHQNIELVLANLEHGAELAVDHFVARQRREMGMLANRNIGFQDGRRVNGFRKALAKHGLTHLNNRIEGTAPSLNGGYLATKNLLGAYPQTNALFAYNDLMALGALRACHELGRRVPDDIAVIGFDDIQLSAISVPSLTSIRIDKFLLGQLAMRRVIDALEHPTQQFSPISIDVELVVRESTQLT